MTGIVPVVLCGGRGTRLWPASHEGRPKHLLDLDGSGEALLEATLRRVADRNRFEAPLLVGSEREGALLGNIAGRAGAGLILEPARRDTAAAIATAALSRRPDELLLVMPSDHRIGDLPAFLAAVETALPHARTGWLVTFGIGPTRPETGYGYLRKGAPLGDGAFEVDAFIEKPAAPTAAALVRGGACLWNAGIFLFRAGAFLDALADASPDIHAAAQDAYRCRSARGAVIRPGVEAYERAPASSVDFAVMERAGKVAVVPADMGWCDVGDWDSFHGCAAKDEAGNSFTGPVVAHDCEGSLFYSDGPVIAGLGLKDLIVVATREGVLVLPRGSAQAVKALAGVAEGRSGEQPQSPTARQ